MNPFIVLRTSVVCNLPLGADLKVKLESGNFSQWHDVFYL